MRYLNQIEELQPLLKGADHIDVKIVEGNISHEEFISSFLSFPKWIQFLFKLRLFLAKFFGLQHKSVTDPILESKDIPLTIGDSIRSFTVVMVKKNQYWVVESPNDKHLKAYLGVFTEPLQGDNKRFYVVTVVYYKHWTGPVYFNIIRPLHHLLVFALAKSAVKNH